MKPTPKGWPRISVGVFYDDAAKAIDWLVKAFGFEVRLKVEGEGGVIEHSELTYGEGPHVGMVMVSQVGRRPFYRSPRSAGGNTMAMMIYVDDVEAHCARAREAGAKIVEEPKLHDYGEEYWTDRGYECEDHEGHHWWFYERLKSGSKS